MDNQNDADRRLLLALFLSLIVLYAWSAWFAPQPAPTPASAESATPTTAGAPTTAAPVAATDPGAPTAAGAPVAVPDREVAIETAELKSRISSRDGAVHDVTLRSWNSEPVVTEIWRWVLNKVTGKASGGWVPYAGGQDPQTLLSDEGALALAGVGTPSAETGWLVETQGDTTIASREVGGVLVTRRIRPADQPYALRVEITFANRGAAPVNGVWVGAVEKAHVLAGRFDNAMMPVGHVDGDLEHLTDLADVAGGESARYDGEVRWLGLGNRYFLLALLPDVIATDQLLFDELPDGRMGAFLVDTRTLAPGEARTRVLTAFAGPKALDVLEPMGASLDEAIEFGFFGFFAKILLALLKLIHSVASNWGVAVILLTVLVKTLFYPLTQASMVSSRRMQAINPQLTALREQYKDDQMRLNQEMMKLFQENKVNPMGGCLPMLLQMPVWLALYSLLLYSVELYDSQFLYLQDLTAADPYAVLPTVVAVLFYLQQSMTPMTGMDATQQKLMKFMPIIFAVFMYTLPSGLVLYITVNTVLSIAQMWFINRRIPAPPAVVKA